MAWSWRVSGSDRGSVVRPQLTGDVLAARAPGSAKPGRMLVRPRVQPSKGSCLAAAAERPISATRELCRAGRVRPSRAIPSSSAAHARMVAAQR
eukprot:15376826-Alexandrium_andersonii.AAC.1